jgi:hypothetical protein
MSNKQAIPFGPLPTPPGFIPRRQEITAMSKSEMGKLQLNLFIEAMKILMNNSNFDDEKSYFRLAGWHHYMAGLCLLLTTI